MVIMIEMKMVVATMVRMKKMTSSWPGPSSNPAKAAPSPMNFGLQVSIDVILPSFCHHHIRYNFLTTPDDIVKSMVFSSHSNHVVS